MNPTLDPDRVLNEVRLMRIEVNSGIYFKDDLTSKYNYIYTNVPHLFDMVLKNEFDYWPMLLQILNKLRTIKNKETMETADADVGEILAKKYVYPVIDTEKEGIDGDF